VTGQEERDDVTGRPLKPLTALSDEELELELTVAASAPDDLRTERYDALLAKRHGAASARASS
jgi:hypothetical protein